MDQAVCLEIKFRSRSFFPEISSRGSTTEILKTLEMFYLYESTFIFRWKYLGTMVVRGGSETLSPFLE